MTLELVIPDLLLDTLLPTYVELWDHTLSSQVRASFAVWRSFVTSTLDFRLAAIQASRLLTVHPSKPERLSELLASDAFGSARRMLYALSNWLVLVSCNSKKWIPVSKTAYLMVELRKFVSVSV